jgi:hypothetical protein
VPANLPVNKVTCLGADTEHDPGGWRRE